MSHFTTVQTKIHNLARLEQVLQELKFSVERAAVGGKVQVKGYLGQKTDAELVIHASRTYDIGVVVDAQTGAVAFVADWEFVETTAGYTQDEFHKRVLQRYAYQTVKEEALQRGYTLESESVDADGHIHVRVTSWGD